MTIDELKTASQQHQTVIYDGIEYTCIGVQVLYLDHEKLISACLSDKQNRLVWAKIEKVRKK